MENEPRPTWVRYMGWFLEFVENYLTFTGKCYRHCQNPTSMRVISRDQESLVGAYVCPDAFVSQVVYFAPRPNVGWFRQFLVNQVGNDTVSPVDIRVATRHGWELGPRARKVLEERLGKSASIMEVYWTRYPKTEQQKQVAVSLCVGTSSQNGCLSIFMHDKDAQDKLCPKCKTGQRV